MLRLLTVAAAVAMLGGCDRAEQAAKPDPYAESVGLPPGTPPEYVIARAMADAAKRTASDLGESPWSCTVECEGCEQRLYDDEGPHYLTLAVQVRLPDDEPVKHLAGWVALVHEGKELLSQDYSSTNEISFAHTSFERIELVYDDANPAHRTLRHKTHEVESRFTPTRLEYADGLVRTKF